MANRIRPETFEDPKGNLRPVPKDALLALEEAYWMLVENTLPTISVMIQKAHGGDMKAIEAHLKIVLPIFTQMAQTMNREDPVALLKAHLAEQARLHGERYLESILGVLPNHRTSSPSQVGTANGSVPASAAPTLNGDPGRTPDTPSPPGAGASTPESPAP